MSAFATYSRLGRFGRLGNQMFQIASTIGIAESNGLIFGFPEWTNYDGAKRGGDFNVQRHFRNPLPGKPVTSYRRVVLGWGYKEVRIAESSDIWGYLQSWKYFERSQETVRHYFEFANKPEPREGCAIHVRRGDYKGPYYAQLGPEYYLPAMDYIGGDKFTVYTDSPEEVEWLSKYATIAEKGNEVEDLAKFSSHRSYITANSSYSWWGAYLGGGLTVGPKRWFGPAYKYLPTKDIIPPKWKLL